MQLVHTHCAGLDVHEKTVVAFVRIVEPDGTKTTPKRKCRQAKEQPDRQGQLLSAQRAHPGCTCSRQEAGHVLAGFYRRLAGRRGKWKAIVAVAHKILVIVYTLLSRGELYQERGTAVLDERHKDRLLERLQRRIAQLGYSVTLEPTTAPAA